MPSLNLRLSDKEMADLKIAAQERGVPVSVLARARLAGKDVRVEASAASLAEKLESALEDESETGPALTHWRAACGCRGPIGTSPRCLGDCGGVPTRPKSVREGGRFVNPETGEVDEVHDQRTLVNAVHETAAKDAELRAVIARLEAEALPDQRSDEQRALMKAEFDKFPLPAAVQLSVGFEQRLQIPDIGAFSPGTTGPLPVGVCDACGETAPLIVSNSFRTCCRPPCRSSLAVPARSLDSGTAITRLMHEELAAGPQKPLHGRPVPPNTPLGRDPLDQTRKFGPVAVPLDPDDPDDRTVEYDDFKNENHPDNRPRRRR